MTPWTTETHSYHRTPLHYAALRGHLDVAEYLLSKGANINARDNASETPLYEAATEGYADLVKFLLSNGADLHIQSGSGSPIRVAALLGNVDVVRILIRNGADPNGKDSSGETALHSAIRPGLRPANVKPMVELLLSEGAQIEAKDDRNGRTPLHVAAEEGSIELIILLLSKGASIKARTNTLETPLHSAAQRTWKPKKEIVAALLSKGADVDAKDFLGSTPLHKVVKMKLGLTLDEIRARNDPMHLDAMRLLNDQLETIKLFLANGADVNARDNDNFSALHWAAWASRSDIADILLNNGADKNARNKFGDTPLHEAADVGAIEVVKLLVDRGAEINIKGNAGYTPLKMAISRGHQDVVDYLRDSGATE